MSENEFIDPPHPDFAELKNRDGLEWWEWKRPEDGVLQIQLTGKGVLSDVETDKLGGHFLDDSAYVILAHNEDVDIYKPMKKVVEGVENPFDDRESRLLMCLRKKVFPKRITDPAYGILRRAAGTSKNRGMAAGIATAEGLGKDPSRFISRGGSTAGYLTEDGHISNTSESNQVLSGIVGNFNWTPRNPYCRQTAFTREHVTEFAMAIPFFEAINVKYKECIPERWENQRQFVSDEVSVQKGVESIVTDSLTKKGWMIGDTVFSTITVNKNYRTGVHKDAGDLPNGFGNLTVLEGEDKYEGGRTIFPKYRCAVDLRTGDFLGMDVHEWHGNTEMKSAVEGKDNWERISVVCYVRVDMLKCGTVSEEKVREKNFFDTRFKNPKERHANLVAKDAADEAHKNEFLAFFGVEAPPAEEVPASKPSSLKKSPAFKSMMTEISKDFSEMEIEAKAVESIRDAEDARIMKHLEEWTGKPASETIQKANENIASHRKNPPSKEQREAEAKAYVEAGQEYDRDPSKAADGHRVSTYTGPRPKAIWIVGEPGVGKTTLVRAIVGDVPLELVPNQKWTIARDFVLAGHYTGGTFDGGDTVSHDVGPTLTYWEANLLWRPYTIFDGDRFSDMNKKTRIDESADPYVVLLLAPEEVVEARRKQRGSNQNATWLKGRKTKSAKFANYFPTERRLVLDAQESVASLAAKVNSWIRGEKVESMKEEDPGADFLSSLGGG